MAMLEKIRNKAGLLVIVVGVALFAFIIGDFLNSGSTFFRQSQEKVADVDGTVISIHDYQARVDEMVSVYQMQTNSNNVPEEMMGQLRQSVFDAIVQEIILGKTASKLGLAVTPEELFDLVQGDNISPMIQQMQLFVDPETGMFDKLALLNFLKTIDDDNIATYPAEQQGQLISARNFWLFWEKNLKQQTLANKYTTLLSKAVSANVLDAKNAFNSTSENSDIVYTMQSYSTVPDSVVTVSSGEIKALYDQRKSSFKQKEGRVINYITADITPSQEDYERARIEIERIREELASTGEEDVVDLVNETSEIPYMDVYQSESFLTPIAKEFVSESAEAGTILGPVFEDNRYNLVKLISTTVAPDSVKVHHIMLAEVTEAATTALADSLIGVLKGGGNFAELAGQYSVDRAELGGEIGWFTETTALSGLTKEIKDAIFNISLNEVVAVKTAYGTHLVKISEKTRDVKKYKIANIETVVTPSSKTYSDIFNELNQYISRNSDIAKMEETARDAGYNMISNVTVTADDQTLGFLSSSRPVIRWAFENGKGAISEIFECGDKFVVAAVLGKVKEGYSSVESVTPSLRAELISKKKGEQIVQDLSARNLTSVDAYAEAMNSSVDSVKYVNFATSRIANIGVEPKLNAMISLTRVNQISTPVAGTNGVYVFNVHERNKEVEEYDEEETIQELEFEYSYRVGYQAIQELLDNSKVEDNRIRFY